MKKHRIYNILWQYSPCIVLVVVIVWLVFPSCVTTPKDLGSVEKGYVRITPDFAPENGYIVPEGVPKGFYRWELLNERQATYDFDRNGNRMLGLFDMYYASGEVVGVFWVYDSKYDKYRVLKIYYFEGTLFEVCTDWDGDGKFESVQILNAEKT